MKSSVSNFIVDRRCKVCFLLKDHKKIYDKIHSLRFRRNFSLKKIAEAIKEDIVGIDFKYSNSITIPNLSRHFRKHISEELSVQYKVQKLMHSPAKETKHSEVPESTFNNVSNIAKEKSDSVYDRMEELYVLVKDQLDTLVKLQDAGEISPPFYKALTALVREVRGTITDIENIKNNDMLVKIIVGTVLQNYTEGILQKMLGEISEFRKALNFYIKDKSTVDSIIQPLEQSVGRHVLDCSTKALDSVVKKYKIK